MSIEIYGYLEPATNEDGSVSVTFQALDGTEYPLRIEEWVAEGLLKSLFHLRLRHLTREVLS